MHIHYFKQNEKKIQYINKQRKIKGLDGNNTKKIAVQIRQEQCIQI